MKILLTVVVVLVAFVLFLGAVLLFKSRKKTNGSSNGTHAASTAPGVTPGASAGGEPGLLKKYGKYFWSALFALAGVAVFIWGLYTPGLRLPQVGDWSWNHWLWLLAFWGIVAALIALNAETLGTATKRLQEVLVAAMFLLFIGIPAGFWVRDIFLPQVICPDVSAHETRSCVLNTAWSSWVKIGDGPVSNGMQMCSTPVSPSERIDVNGTTFWRFKADEGRLVKAYRLFPPNEACPATL